MAKRLAVGAAVATLMTLGSGYAQTPLQQEEILKLWLASPHADGDAQAFKHWNSEGEIPGVCAVCHSTPGVVSFLSGPQLSPGIIDQAISTGSTIECTACHNPAADALSTVVFPSGLRQSLQEGAAICSVCHQGRTSSSDVDAATAAITDDEVSSDLTFINIHYAAAGATRLGGSAKGGYQYAGLDYAGPFSHAPNMSECTDCHDPHSTQISIESCTSCHEGVTDVRDIGMPQDSTSTAVQIGQLHERLGNAIATYAKEVAGEALIYAEDTFPYFFHDLNDDGLSDSEETIFPNKYAAWSPRLLKAAYNFQFVAKDPGAFAHNPHYVTQLLVDSIRDLSRASSVSDAGLERP